MEGMNIKVLGGISLVVLCAAIALVLLPGKTSAPSPDTPGIPDLISVHGPLPGDAVSSPLAVRGSARGPWYFEATFPIDIKNAAGDTIAQGYAEAQGEWMTEEYVGFSASVPFPAQPAGSAGTVVLHKANASGLPEHDRSLTIPVVF